MYTSISKKFVALASGTVGATVGSLIGGATAFVCSVTICDIAFICAIEFCRLLGRTPTRAHIGPPTCCRFIILASTLVGATVGGISGLFGGYAMVTQKIEKKTLKKIANITTVQSII